MATSEFEADLAAARGDQPRLETAYRCAFGRGGWRADDWLMLKCPRFDQPVARWTQQDDHIVNPVPEGASPEALMGELAPETYVTMVLRRRCAGPAAISATMSFDHRMAPLILIAPELAADAQGRPEYRQHWEIVLYDEGINVWQHRWDAGACSLRLAAHCAGAFRPLTPYRLSVELLVNPDGKELNIACGDVAFGFCADALPDAYYVGITACEGVNRFYDFQLDGQFAPGG